MPTITSQEATVDREASELRQELTDLQSAMASLSERLVQTGRAREAAEHDLARHQEMLLEALDLRKDLEHRLAELETDLAGTRKDLERERLTSRIRAMLLTEIAQARPWRRGAALRRAAKVQQLLKG